MTSKGFFLEINNYIRSTDELFRSLRDGRPIKYSWCGQNLMVSFCSAVAFIYFLPGFSLVCLFNGQRWRFFYSLGLSLSLFAICLFFLIFFKLTWAQLTFGYLSVTLVLTVLALYKIIVGRTFSLFSIHFEVSDLLICTSIAITYGAYLLVFGPYDELPSDFYRHLERIQLIHRNLENPESTLTATHLYPNGYYIYYIYAVTWSIGKISLENAIFFFSWLHGVIVITSIYLFSSSWLARTFYSPRILALAACILFVLHQGVGPFAFLRYYALSPSLICFPLIFLAIIIFIEHLEKNTTRKEKFFGAACVAVPFFYHFQELLFMAIAIWLLSAYYSACYWLRMFKQSYLSPGLVEQRLRLCNSPHASRAVVVFVALTAALIALYIFSLVFFTRSTPDVQKILTLPLSIPLIGPLQILNPSYQFLQTIGAFGILIYASFFIFIRRFSSNSFLFVGMLVPLFTVWNPFFVDLFLRLRDPHVLYRIGYMIPFTISAAYVLGLILSSNSTRRLSRVVLVFTWISACAMSLLPWKIAEPIFSHSRLHTLKTVAQERSFRHWDDMIMFLRDYGDRKIIYTDPVTGYMVSALTQHYSFRYKFTTEFHRPINFESYADGPLARYEGGLLILNLREGGLSESGMVSGHWPLNVLKLRQYYSPGLIQHVINNPDFFPIIWNGDNISIHQIYPNNEHLN